MKCPACSHVNVSDFPFCEECLTLLPARPGNELAFELDVETETQKDKVVGWPPFPWNPPDLAHRLFGRDKSLTALIKAWENVTKTWTSQVHLCVSEFGMGKTQLMSEFSEEAIRREPQGRVIRVRCPESGGPYRLWDSVVRALFDIEESAGPEEAGESLLQGAKQYLTDEVDEVARVIADLLGYRLPGVQVQRGVNDGQAIVSRGAGALSRLLGAVAQEPFLLLISMANRGSAASLALVGALEASLKDRPAMMVLTGTPELTHILPGWDRFPVTRLAPLPSKDAQALVQFFLTGLENVPVELVTRIVERAKGSPWAIKSLLHYLGEAGAISVTNGQYTIDESVCWDLEWPDDLEGVVLARLSSLSARDRAVLGYAGVVGSVFWTGALVALEREQVEAPDTAGLTVRDNLTWELSRSLERLAALRFIGRRSSTIPGEDGWGFRSPLHLQVASTIVPEAARVNYHATIEQWLRVHNAGTPSHHLKLLAHHAEMAGDMARATDYSWRAARNALRNHQPAEAQKLLLQAGGFVRATNRPTRMEIALDLGDARLALSDLEGALDSYQEALHIAWQLRQRSKGADALVKIGRVQTNAARYEKAYTHFEAALRLYEERNESEGVATVCLMLGKMLWVKGSPGEALQFYRKAERLYEELGNRRGQADVNDAFASLHYDRGDLKSAEHRYRKAIQVWNQIDDPRGVATGLCNLGVAWLAAGRVRKAIKAWEEALELATITGNLALQAAIGANMGEGLIFADRFDEADSILERAAATAERAGNPTILAEAFLNQAVLASKRAEWALAVELLERTKAMVEEVAIPRLIARLERVTADLFIERFLVSDNQAIRHVRNAAKHYRTAISLYVDAGSNLESARTHELLADALQLLGKEADATRERETAQEIIELSHYD
ncbi:MAG: tetratricopeptide repeat protein [Myxococcota bacterium]|nr:tetratricopeptide repeat protein [Myxococcota bacterium]